MKKRKTFPLKLFSLLCLLIVLSWSLPVEAPARTGRGQSGGKSTKSQDLRSTKPEPKKPGGQATTPSRTGLATNNTARKVPPSASQSTDSLWRGLGGGFLAGLLGRWLFGGPETQAGSKSGDSYGVGLLDLILLLGLGYAIYWLITKTRRQQAAALHSAPPNNPVEPGLPPPDELEPPPPSEPQWDLETGLRYIEQSDPLFSETKFKDQALDYFFKIQGAWVDRNLSSVRHLLTEEMFDLLRQDADKMRRDGLINRLENLGVREVNLTQAWQESGQDYLIMRICLTLLDYTLNEKTGEIVSGSQVEPVQFEESWTFSRPSGNNPWQLSAISQAEGASNQ